MREMYDERKIEAGPVEFGPSVIGAEPRARSLHEEITRMAEPDEGITALIAYVLEMRAPRDINQAHKNELIRKLTVLRESVHGK